MVTRRFRERRAGQSRSEPTSRQPRHERQHQHQHQQRSRSWSRSRSRPQAQPTALLRFADAGHLFATWRWTDDLASPGAAVTEPGVVADAVAELAAALPSPENPVAALTGGAFASYDAELALGRHLTRALLPPGLAMQLDELHGRGVRPRLRIQPSPSVAQVPWELLATDPEDIRLVEIADLSVLAPASVVHAAGRTPSDWHADRALPVVAVLDPRVPGFRADSRLGSVLGRMTPEAPLARRVAEHARLRRLRPTLDAETSDGSDAETPDGSDAALAAFRRTDLDRDWLAAALDAGASRLLYVGHVTAAAPESGESEHAQLHLACPAEAAGFAPPLRAHRPLSAKDLLLGTPGPAGRWRFPSRVALVACESGGELRFGEALGLATAMVHGGAELVTATRWPLPTDHAFPTGRPLQDAICAIDAAHDADDPVAALCAWQRGRLAAWREHRTVDHSPVLWSAFATIDARVDARVAAPADAP
ncbi:CHAT domain-containing protein [Streptomyces sp. 4N509B]|uniref:CHAT domain-containing protein n=1 Tax=Streptomyces sp. 4N509B TaxID=3457413 RepID=UPI003FD4817B